MCEWFWTASIGLVLPLVWGRVLVHIFQSDLPKFWGVENEWDVMVEMFQMKVFAHAVVLSDEREDGGTRVFVHKGK